MSDSNLFPIFNKILSREDKEKQLNQSGFVVWMYGLSGSGKSTLASLLEKYLYEQGKVSVLLDGDNIRTGLNKDLGFSDLDRKENIRRIAEVAQLFKQNGIIVIASFITPTKQLRNLAKNIIGEKDYFDIFIKASYETCLKRDPKSLYKKVEKHNISNFTGKGSTFEEPEDFSKNNVEINTELNTEKESLNKIISFIEHKLN